MIEAGVNIYEFTPGFVHAKVFVSDDDTATVGTVNLDYRSLYLHFECGIFVYDNPVVHKIEKDFQETLKRAVKLQRQISEIPVFYADLRKSAASDRTSDVEKEKCFTE